MRNFKTEGIIIKRRNSGEADRVITIFTKTYGKIQAKAMGVRRITSKRSSHLELLNLVQFNFYKGRVIPLVLETQTIENFELLKNDLTKIGFAFHMCELIDGLCADSQEQPAIFDLLHKTLQELSKSDDIVAVVHEFEVELLTLLGFWSRTTESLHINNQAFIEQILERKLKSKHLLQKLYS